MVRDIIAVVGTTGVGKSKLSIELAKKYNGEVINADSMQMYRGVPVITNKHPLEERAGIAHHVMNHVEWDEEYFVHRFQQEALAAIDEIHSRGKTPIVVGGTHYYLQSILFHNKMVQEEASELTDAERLILDGPPERLFTVLKQHDPVVAEKFHPNDTRKLRRALEIYFTTNRKASAIYKDQTVDQKARTSLRFNTLLFWVWSAPESLEPRLDARVDQMLAEGGMEEIREMYRYRDASTPGFENGIWQVIGFKEFYPWLQTGETDAKALATAIEDMKVRTKKYAKQQVKWIRKKLVAEMAKEKDHGFERGGHLYLLDASDLTRWSENVFERGSTITTNFLEGKPLVLFAPAGLESMVEDTAVPFTADKWKHFQCAVCEDGEGQKLVFVGESQYTIHMQSRKHSSKVSLLKRKQELKEFLAKRQKLTDDSK